MDFGHFIEVIALLSVILNKHKNIGIFSTSSTVSKFLISDSLAIDSPVKSNTVSGTQLLFLFSSHSATIDIAHVYNFE